MDDPSCAVFGTGVESDLAKLIRLHCLCGAESARFRASFVYSVSYRHSRMEPKSVMHFLVPNENDGCLTVQPKDVGGSRRVS